MSNLVHERQGTFPHPPLKKKSKGKGKKKSLLEFIEDPLRKEPLVGLQYVVEVKLLQYNKSVYKCNLCSVRGEISCIIDHLVGGHHLRAFMNTYYYHKIEALRRMKLSKMELQKMLKEYAMKIEKKEGIKCVKVEYVHGKGKNKEIDVWKSKIYDDYTPDYQQKKVTDRRQIALQYSESFKITSRTEANEVLNLTEHLNKLLERYFIKSGGEDLLHIQNTSNVHNQLSKHKQIKEDDIACNSAREKDSGNSKITSGDRGQRSSCWDKSNPSSSSIYTHEDPHKKASSQILKDKRLVLEASIPPEALPPAPILTQNSTSLGSKSRKRKASWTYDELLHSPSTSYYSGDSTNVSGLAHCCAAEDSSSQPPCFTEVSYCPFPSGILPENKVYDTYRKLEQLSSTHHSLCSGDYPMDTEVSHTEAATVTPSVSDTVDPSLSYGQLAPADADPSSSTSNSCEQPSDATSNTCGKTSKTLSPDLLKLLKGKDLSTVIKILKTIAPFYPALQEVNIEMFAQVLLHAGALD
ncbi:uncharacterized protein LOC100158299 [Xenopus laevis]|uniref:LOC100158299 protein n=2 Tax=Xenopus laevis TaxID=8355 RepID=B1H1T3_XENLA|nr:uncharacterized protein LOC100158299 [Xenopus laevis]AAI60729.1 LOC100158299 protein [Xenopus laevis]OCT76171.1 hypothetical protein XELAEV_18031363mg [Xenopus laevis]